MIARLCIGCLVLFSAFSVQAKDILYKKDVESLFQEKLISYQDMIAEGEIKNLQEAVKDFTHEETIILFEFTLKPQDLPEMPVQRAYFNRDPFINLLRNAGSLKEDSFELTYQLDKFQPQYGGGSAIIYDSGTAKGQITEAFSGNDYLFSMTQECRNTISADAETMFKVDSIYCRMDVEYEPVQEAIISVDGADKVLEKPPIDDIISDIEEKKQQETN